MSHFQPFRLPHVLSAAALLGAPSARADWGLNMPVGVTEISHKTYDLHMLAFWICVWIAVLVFGALTYAIFAFRKSKGAKAATWDHSNTAELIWTVIPVMILIGLAIPSARTLVLIEDTRNSDMTIKITGYQWRWQYDYLGTGVNFFSVLAESSNAARQPRSGIDPFTVPHYLLDVDKPMVVPVGKKIRYLVTGADVIHSWWVPDLSIKRDAIPGFVNEGWFRIDEPGTYRGQCAELCGKDHGFMPIVVKAVTQAEFDEWLAAQKAAAAPVAVADNH